MFYSETLLQKTGPLAKVWLAANVERKLTKGDCLKQNIAKDVRNIVNDEQAPLALRLTSQLLLGVVRIYSRKARYLMDDCHETIGRIRVAFRSGDVDLPATQSHIANPAAINMPDTITELDLFAPMPDFEDLMYGPGGGLSDVASQNGLDWGTSQVLPDSLEDSRSASQLQALDIDDLGLDLGLDVTAPSVEVGRRAATPRREETSLIDDVGIELDLGDTVYDQDPAMAGADDPLPLDGDDVLMGDADITERNKAALANAQSRRRETESPLSDMGDKQVEDLERTFRLGLDDDEEQVEDETQVEAQQRAKRRRVLENDTRTELPDAIATGQRMDRSKLLRQASFLPRDPMLLALMNLQRNGGFVSSILGGDQTRGWAPELRGILSIEVVRRAGDLKRKRGTTALPSPPPEDDRADVADDQPLPALDDQPIDMGLDDAPPPQDESLYPPASPGGGAFDETTLAPVPPADSGPVSLATKHTVHMLRERFSSTGGEVPSPGSRKNQSVLFTELCPESRTSRQDATKLFFETLVLATKDAIKVEQRADAGPGAPLRLRAKRGLWGDWAEMGVGGTQEGQEGEEVEV